MKEKLKNTNGITLIALVITIIILLILAMVSISLVMNSGIINHANNAVTAYNEAQTNELQQLNAVEDEMGKYTGTLSNSNLWELSNEEKAELQKFQEENDAEGVIAFSTEKGIEISFSQRNNGGKWLFIETNGNGAYFYTLDDLGTEEIKIILPSAETHRWYRATSGSEVRDMAEYNGECPINASDFDMVGSSSYLNKIIKSFQ